MADAVQQPHLTQKDPTTPQQPFQQSHSQAQYQSYQPPFNDEPKSEHSSQDPG